MAKIDRNSYEDAKLVFEKLLPELEIRQKIIDFLATAIDFTNTLNSEKWNLNLNGGLIRFNVGHEYCIDISAQRILILCNRVTLKPILANQSIQVTFYGRNKITSNNIDDVPDRLAKTKNSIGCILDRKDVKEYIDLFKQSNFDFISGAIKTHQLPAMRQAHSRGAIEYLNRQLNKNIANPIYNETNLPTLTKILENEQVEVERARKMTKKKRLELLAKSEPKPIKKVVSQIVFIRNPYVVAEVLDRANGFCEKCHKPAPFIKDSNDLPYLEVHHKIPLAENGDDTVENTIALCPNCHRQAHYGKKTY